MATIEDPICMDCDEFVSGSMGTCEECSDKKNDKLKSAKKLINTAKHQIIMNNTEAAKVKVKKAEAEINEALKQGTIKS